MDAVNLFGESEPYGPKAPKPHGTTSTHDRALGERRVGRVLPNTGANPAGAPPLDWWLIEEET